jgi:hypothetical protein
MLKMELLSLRTDLAPCLSRSGLHAAQWTAIIDDQVKKPLSDLASNDGQHAIHDNRCGLKAIVEYDVRNFAYMSWRPVI